METGIKQLANLRLRNGTPISAETRYELTMMYQDLSDAVAKKDFLDYVTQKATKTSDPSKLIFGAPPFEASRRIYEETRMRKREGVTMSESEYTCVNPDCRSTKIAYTRVQANAGDEGTKTIFQCLVCNKKWQTR